ncbi:MAG: hypothetical protein JKY65_05570 [Planctomycetes bacterium]|nr:hypothetical protein [Planctomycetota bacterium]
MSALNALYKKHKKDVEFFVVYIREAHAADSSWPDRRTEVLTPRSFEERKSVAKTCSIKLKIDLPLLIDDMRNTTEKKYRGWPDRLFLIGKDGRVVYRGGRGPWGFKPALLQAAIKKELGGQASPKASSAESSKKRWF